MQVRVHQRAIRSLAVGLALALAALGLTVGATELPAGAAPVCPGSAAVVNGSFEIPVIAARSAVQMNQTLLPGWRTTSPDGIVELWSSGYTGTQAAAGGGKQFVELNATGPSALYQTIPTASGEVIAWSLVHRAVKGTDVMAVQAGPDGGTLTTVRTISDKASSGWRSYSGTYTVPAGQTSTRFAFAAISSGGKPTTGNLLDLVTLRSNACVTGAAAVNPSGTVPVGATLTTSVTAANQGGGPASALTVSAALPVGTAFVPGSITVDVGGGPVAQPDTAYDAGSRTVRVTPDGGALAAGASATLAVRTTVEASAAGGTLTTTGRISSTDEYGTTSTFTTDAITTSVGPLLVAAPDAYRTGYGQRLDVATPGVLANDTGTGLVVVSGTTPAHGAATLAANGAFAYVPAAGYAGPDSFTYTVVDAWGQRTVGTVTVTVDPPAAPTARPDTYTHLYGAGLTVAAPGVLADDDGVALQVTTWGAAAHGTVVGSPDGGFTYTPTGSTTEPDTFAYVATDPFGQTASATVTVAVERPAPPVAGDDAAATAYRTPLHLAAPGVLGNDLGTGLAVVAVTPAGHGTAAVGADGTLDYLPDDGFAGTDAFTYTVADPFGQSATATVSVVVALPAAPVAVDDAHHLAYGATLAVDAPGVLGNDTGTDLTVAVAEPPAHGTLVLDPDGALTFSPDAGFAGADAFGYVATDRFGRSATAAVTLTVDLPPAPVPAADDLTTPYRTALALTAPGVLGNDTGTDLTVVAHGPAAHGTAVVAADGSLTYTPEVGFAGVDTFTYTVADRFGRTAIAPVAVAVVPPPAPVTADDEHRTAYATALTVAAPGVLDGDTGTGIDVRAWSPPAHGLVAGAADGSFTYTPDEGFAGVDTFTYVIEDEVGQTATGAVRVTVDPPPAPVANDDAATTGYRSPLTLAAPGVLGNDAGTGLAVSGWGTPGHGTVAGAADGSFTYSPEDGFVGTDAFTYTVADPFGRTASATVTMTVALPPPPVAVDEGDSTPFGVPRTVAAPGVLGNDVGIGLTVTGHTEPAHGSVDLAADGSFTYTPDDGAAGPDPFGYTVTDRFGRSASATVWMTVSPPVAPVATGDTFTVAYGAVLDVAAPGVLANDAGHLLTVTSWGAAGHGAVEGAADGSFRYTPVAGFEGADTFTYVVTDPFGQQATAAVDLVVGQPPTTAIYGDASLAPTARPDHYWTWTGDAGYPDGSTIWFADILADGRIVVGSMTQTSNPTTQANTWMGLGIFTPPPFTTGPGAAFDRVDVGRIVRTGMSTWNTWSTTAVPTSPIGGGDVSEPCIVQQGTVVAGDPAASERVLGISAVPRRVLGEASTVGQYPGVVMVNPYAAAGSGAVDGRVDVVESETTSELAADAPVGTFPLGSSFFPVSQLTECSLAPNGHVVASQYATPVTAGNPANGTLPSNGNGAIVALDPNGETANRTTGDGRLTVPASLVLGQVTYVLDDGTASPPVVAVHPRDIKASPVLVDGRVRLAMIADATYTDKTTGQTASLYPLQFFEYDPVARTIAAITPPFVSDATVDFNTSDGFDEDGTFFVTRNLGLAARSGVVYEPDDLPFDRTVSMAPGSTVAIRTFLPTGSSAVGHELPELAWPVAAPGWTEGPTASWTRSVSVADDRLDGPSSHALLTVTGNGVVRILRWDHATKTATAYCDVDLYGPNPQGTGRWVPAAGIANGATIVEQGVFDPVARVYYVPIKVFLTAPSSSAVHLPLYLGSVRVDQVMTPERVRTSPTDTCATATVP